MYTVSRLCIAQIKFVFMPAFGNNFVPFVDFIIWLKDDMVFFRQAKSALLVSVSVSRGSIDYGPGHRWRFLTFFFFFPYISCNFGTSFLFRICKRIALFSFTVFKRTLRHSYVVRLRFVWIRYQSSVHHVIGQAITLQRASIWISAVILTSDTMTLYDVSYMFFY